MKDFYTSEYCNNFFCKVNTLAVPYSIILSFLCYSPTFIVFKPIVTRQINNIVYIILLWDSHNNVSFST